MRGRRNKSAALKVVGGNAGKRGKKGKDSATGSGKKTPPGNVVPMSVPAPQYLTDKAKELWDRIAPELVKRRKYCPLFREELAKYCAAFGRWRHAEKQVTAKGHVVTAQSGFEMMSPWLVISNKAQEQMRQLAGDLGLNLMSMVRVEGAQMDLFAGGGEAKGKTGDPWADM